MSSVTATRKVSEVATYVKRQFGDESGVQITDTDIIRWVNLGQQEIFIRNEPIKKTATAALVAGQYQYTFPSDVMRVERLRVSNKTIEQISFNESDEYINATDPNNDSDGTPQVWYEYGGSFMFWPVPNTSDANGITIYYVPAPTAVAALADTLSLPDVYYPRLLEYVMKQAYELDENFDASQVKSNEFATGLESQADDSSVDTSYYPRITVLPEDM